MSTLSTLGIVHTLISLAAVGSGIGALARYRVIGPASALGKLYIAGTVLSCLTSLFIFAHGGFGKPHVLALVTLAVLALAWALARRWQRIASLLYSFTLFLHMVPATTETLTRLPVDAPLAASPDAPLVSGIIAGFFVTFLVGAVMQWRGLPAHGRLPGMTTSGSSRH
jgi:uncharacterized membrane protein